MGVTTYEGLSRNYGVSTVSGASVKGVIAALRRYFHDLDAAAMQYYSLGAPVTLSGDFEIEVAFATSSVTRHSLLGGTDKIQINGAGQLEYTIGGAQRVIAVSSPFSGAINTYSVKRTGSVQSSYQNGALLLTDAINTNNTVFDAAGLFSGVYVTGIVPSVKIWTGGDRNTGTKVVDIDFNTDLSTPVVSNKAAVLGSELYDGGIVDPVNGGTLTINGDGTYTVTGTGSIASGVRDNVADYMVDGKTYLISATGINGDVYISAYDGSYSLISSGKNAVIVTAQATTRLYVSPSTQLSVTYNPDNISIREIPAGYPYAIAVNMTSADAWQATQVGADWLGEELVVNGGFDTDMTGWIVSNVSSVNGVATFSASGFMYQDCAPPNQLVRVSFDGNSVTTPQLKIGDNSNSLGRMQFNGNAGSTVDNVSVKRLIPIAGA